MIECERNRERNRKSEKREEYRVRVGGSNSGPGCHILFIRAVFLHCGTFKKHVFLKKQRQDILKPDWNADTKAPLILSG